MFIDVRVKYPSFLSDFNKTWIFFQKIFGRYPNIRFHEYPSSGSRVVALGQTDRHITKLIVIFRNFAPKYRSLYWVCAVPIKSADCSIRTSQETPHISVTKFSRCTKISVFGLWRHIGTYKFTDMCRTVLPLSPVKCLFPPDYTMSHSRRLIFILIIVKTSNLVKTG
jgi:hypothetical protein